MAVSRIESGTHPPYVAQHASNSNGECIGKLLTRLQEIGITTGRANVSIDAIPEYHLHIQTAVSAIGPKGKPSDVSAQIHVAGVLSGGWNTEFLPIKLRIARANIFVVITLAEKQTVCASPIWLGA